MEKMANKLTDWIIKNDPDSADQREVLIYVLQCSFGMLLANCLFLIIAAIMSMALQAVIWTLFYNALRFYIGGFHAKTFLGCLTGGTLFSLLCLTAVNYITGLPVVVLFILIAGSILITFFAAPVIHPNRRMSGRKIKHNHSIAKLIVLIESFAIVMMYLFWNDWAAYSALMGVLMACILCLTGKILEKKNEG